MTHALQVLESRLQKQQGGGGDKKCPNSISVETRPLRDRSGEMTRVHLEAVARRQQTEESDVVVLVLLRDPVERFLSALGQAWLMKDSAQKLHAQCGQHVHQDNNKSRFVQCAVNLLSTTTRSYAEVEAHLCPQAAQIRTNNVKGIRASAWDMSDHHHLDVLLQHLVSHEYASHHHARDRSNVAYSHSKTLSTLRVQDLEPELIRQICDLYQVDVDLRRSIGMTNVWC